MGPKHHLSSCACITAWFLQEWQVYIGSSPHLWFLHTIKRLLEQNYKSLLVPELTCRFIHAIQRDFHRNDKSIWVAALICGFVLQNSEFRPDLQVCMGPRHHLLFWAHITACLAQEWKDYISSCPHLWFYTCKSARLAPEKLVSMCPSTHLLFLHAKQRPLEQRYKSV